MDFLLLGTAQDGGLPHIGCACPQCRRAARDPQAARFVASAALVDPASGSWCLFDPSPDAARQLALLRSLYEAGPAPAPDRLRVFVTHLHLGHYWGLGFFGKEGLDVRGLPVHAGPRATDFFRDNEPFRSMEQEGRLRFEVIEPGRPWEEWARVEAVEVPHRAEFSETYAFRITGPRASAFYMPDADRLPDDLVEQAGSADFAFLDGTFHDRDEIPGLSDGSVPHPPVAETAAFLRQARGWKARTVFTHLNHTNPLLRPESPERRALEEKGFRVAEDGDAVAL